VSRRTTTDWDAETYDRLAAPQEEWGRQVLERLPLEGGETVLDAGCGSGRVTRLLVERLPRGKVIGVDGSPSMIATAGQAFGDDDRVTLITSDLLTLTPEVLEREAGIERVDAIFSNATFHWIADHDQLFGRLFALLRPGGRLVAQCGGKGNVAEWRRAVDAVRAREPFAAHLDGFEPWSFYDAGETRERLAAAGFTEISCERIKVDPVHPDDPGQFVSVVGLAAHNERLPEELREPFAEAVIGALPEPLELTYIRLNIDARRA